MRALLLGVVLTTGSVGVARVRHFMTPRVAEAASATDVVRSWYSNGALKSERRYVDGREDGVHDGWYEDGRPRFHYRYVRGVMEGEATEWYPTGQPFTRFHYRAGQEQGRQQMWTTDGVLRANYVVVDGRRFGLMGSAGCKGTADSTRNAP
jgi:antitoxin component YwqK of YwqJK toxin-antitoxin module